MQEFGITYSVDASVCRDKGGFVNCTRQVGCARGKMAVLWDVPAQNLLKAMTYAVSSWWVMGVKGCALTNPCSWVTPKLPCCFL